MYILNLIYIAVYSNHGQKSKNKKAIVHKRETRSFVFIVYSKVLFLLYQIIHLIQDIELYVCRFSWVYYGFYCTVLWLVVQEGRTVIILLPRISLTVN